jgi:hypothetical protein
MCMMARAMTTGLTMAAVALGGEAINLGNRRELFVDQFLIEKLAGEARLQLHRPVRREIVFRADAPWEGNGSGYQSVFRDGDRLRMYYRGGHHVASAAYQTDPRSWETLCLAESEDGIHWTRPDLGIVDFHGSKQNNLLLDASTVKAFGGSPAHTAVFKDANPNCPEAERYKIVMFGTKPRGLYLLVSADGIHFAPKSTTPFMTTGAFDSQNLAFWDPVREEYRLYHRGFNKGVRDVLTCTAPDFASFPEPHWVSYPDSPTMALYTNQIQPYYRAPHLFMGFPMRYNERGWSGPMLDLPGLDHRLARAKHHPRYGMTVTDAVFMTSRDGQHFHRWAEAFVRPGPRQKESWVYGDNFLFWGMFETPSATEDAPPELSFLGVEGYWEDEDTAFRRYTLRIDGFVSAYAPYAGGEILTKPIVFAGGSLSVNAETSGFGSFQVEVQDPDGSPLPGYTLAECEPIFCDSLDYTVCWHTSTGGDLRPLAGKPVRLRFVLKDADIYSFQFVLFRPAPERPGAPDLGILPPKTPDCKPFTVLDDDFQAVPASLSTTDENRLPATGDEDSGWVIRRGSEDRVRLLNDDPVGSGKPGRDHYLMVARKAENMAAGGRAWITLSPQDAADTTNGTVVVKARLYVPSTNRAAVDIDAFDSRVEEFQRRAFHVRFWPDGTVSYYKSITNKIAGLAFQPDTWIDVEIRANLAKSTFALTIGSQTVTDLPFAEENVHRVQCIGLNPNTNDCTLYVGKVSVTVQP